MIKMQDTEETAKLEHRDGATEEFHAENALPNTTSVPMLTNKDDSKGLGNNTVLKEQIAHLQLLLQQKDNTVELLEREKIILEKEKLSLKSQIEYATKEKENAVMRFATKEKQLMDSRKEKELLDKQLSESKREIKNISTKYYVVIDDKTRLTSIVEEKCNELKRLQKENEKLKTDVANLEMKLKWNIIKLNQETDGKLAAEKKLEEYSDRGLKPESKVLDQQNIEKEANLILLKHENEEKEKLIDSLRRELRAANEKLSKLENVLSTEEQKRVSLSSELECLKEEYNYVQNTLSQEILNSAKLRSELDTSKILKAQNTINEEKITTLEASLETKDNKLDEYTTEISHLRNKESELLNINKEMTEMIVGLQNQLYLQNSKIKAIEAENTLLRKEKFEFDTKLQCLKLSLNEEIEKKNQDRFALARHLSEKTKLYETTKGKLDNVIGELEATKKKHTQIIKELQREISKCKKKCTEQTETSGDESTRKCNVPNHSDSESEVSKHIPENTPVCEPSKQHLVDRILRLQQAAARQTEKIDFLENHTMTLVSELQKKSKILQYYMLRDQAGALTSSRSDQNKSELARYGGVMSAIYTGIKGNNQSMTLELSLEINKKLQAVLEDTLLKNITLKENLDVLGLEVDKLTRQLAKAESKKNTNT